LSKNIFKYVIEQNRIVYEGGGLTMVGTRKHLSVLVGLLVLLTTFVGMQASVVAAGEPPVAAIGGPYESYECNSLLFDASSSYDPEGAVLQYRWNIEGTWTDWSSNPYEEHIWLDDYSGFITLEVSDGDFVSQASTTVVVSNVAPFIQSIDSPTAAVEAGTTVRIGLHYFDGDLREMVASLDACTAVFSWGDGSITTYQMKAGATVVNASHVYAKEGSYDIAIVLSDDDGGTSQTSVHLVVNPSSVPPQAPPTTPPPISPRTFIQMILNMRLSRGLLMSLLERLGNLDFSYNVRIRHMLINRLGAFINFVEALRGKWFTKAQADALISGAQALIDTLKKM
jgi:hypothetical protein